MTTTTQAKLNNALQKTKIKATAAEQLQEPDEHAAQIQPNSNRKQSLKIIENNSGNESSDHDNDYSSKR